MRPGKKTSGGTKVRGGARAGGRATRTPIDRPASSPAERRRAIAELRVLAHPLRLRLFELFAEKARTTMQVAELLGEPPTRLYHHVNALEKAGLLHLKETRPIRGTVEKYYQAAVEGVRGAANASMRRDPEARQSLLAAASAVIEQARQDLLACMREPSDPSRPGPVLLRMLLVMPPSRAAMVRKRLLGLIQELREEFGEGEEPKRRKASPGDERWSVTVAFAPSWPRRAPGGPDPAAGQ